jgi:hypothetical protein
MFELHTLVCEDKTQDPATGNEILYRTAFIIEVLITAESTATLRNTQGRLWRWGEAWNKTVNAEGLELQELIKTAQRSAQATHTRHHTPTTNQSRTCLRPRFERKESYFHKWEMYWDLAIGIHNNTSFYALKSFRDQKPTSEAGNLVPDLRIRHNFLYLA